MFYQRDAIFINIERKQVEIASLLVVYHVGLLCDFRIFKLEHYSNLIRNVI